MTTPPTPCPAVWPDAATEARMLDDAAKLKSFPDKLWWHKCQLPILLCGDYIFSLLRRVRELEAELRRRDAQAT